jgi:putative ABC transport system permease protein
MHEILHDLRYAARRLRRSPGFTATALATLAVGIGAITAVFSVTDAFLLRPLPFAAPEELVHVWQTDPRMGDELRVSIPDFEDLRAQSAVLADLGGYYYTSYTLATEGTPAKVETALLTPGLFDLLGVRPLLGRTFTADDGSPGGERVVVLSQAFWRRHFAAAPSALGSTLTLDDLPYTVVGVMPEEFIFPFKTVELWVPLSLAPFRGDRAGNGPLMVVGRLAPGRTRAAAQTELAGIMERLARQYPADDAGKGIHVVPLRQALLFFYDMFRTTSAALLGAVGFVLLIVCANLGNLLLARASGRGREIGIRTALGAGRRRLLRQLMTESVLLALAGGALGAGLAQLALGPVKGLMPGELYRVGEIGVDGKALLATLVVSLGAALLFGLAPARQALRRDVTAALKAGVGGEAASPRLRNSLVVGEIALAMLLVAGATLMVRTFFNLARAETGFEARGVLTAETILPKAKYPSDREENLFYDEVLRRARSLPGVEAAAQVYPLPLNFESAATGFTVAGTEAPRLGEAPVANQFWASADAFRTLGIPLLRGRAFTAADDAGSLPVAVVNQRFAERYLAGADPVGRRLTLEDGGPVTVVGVVGDSKIFLMNEEPAAVVYLPQLQHSTRRRFLLLRTAGDPLALAAPVRAAVAALDPELPVTNVRTLEGVVRESLGPWLGGTAGLGLLGMGALLLAVMGIYGVVSYTVSLRTREIGIRVALGAGRGQIVRLVLGHGLRLTALGVVLGTLAALGLAQLLQVLLYGVDRLDPLTLLGAPAFLAAVALFATYVPARRAARVEATEALRAEY